MRRMLKRAVVLLLGLASLLATLLVARAAIPGIRGTQAVSSQLTWLRRVNPRAAPEMQRLFPEGEFFQWALSGLAAGRLARDGVDPADNLALLEEAIAATGASQVVDRFGAGDPLPHGAFYHGWRLLLLVDRAALTGDPAQRAEVETEARRILTALQADPLPASYPGRAWPCDVVVALAAAHLATGLVELAGLPAVTRQWFAAVETHRDPSGLLVHRRGGDVARGSSQAIIQAFLPDIDPVRAAREWRVFKEQFVVSELGLVGVREYPRGVADDGDVDSGPLVAGVSASASAVTLAAARRNGDLELAKVLDREADLLGLPLPMGSGAAFALGLMPVGDAFVAWARSAPLGAALDVPSPQPWFWLFWLLALVPGVVALWMCRRRIAGLVALRRPGSAGRREECQHIKDGASEPGGSVMNETTVGR